MAIDDSERIHRAILVSRYASPLAVLLVALGLVFTQPTGSVRNISIGLLIFSIAFNLVAAVFLKGPNANLVLRLRFYANTAVNAVLVYVFGRHWPPMWVLFLLSPIGTALYGSKRETYAVSGSMAALLLLIAAARGAQAPIEWAEQVANGSVIVCVSVLIHELRHPRFDA